MRKVGLFGGSFDPVHFGHVNLALEILEKRYLDEILFCPAFHSPFKKSKPIASPSERLEMIRLTTEAIPSFKILDWEIQNERVSYTVETLRFLKKQLSKQSTLYLILSQDSLSRFALWKNVEEIVTLAQPLIGTRQGFCQQIPPSPISSHLTKGLIETRMMDISSTEIRRRIKERLYCGHLLSQGTLEFVKRRNLYTQGD